MEKTIDFSKTVYEICKQYPEAVEVLRELGFEQIVNPAMLNTAGRIMTIPKGAAMRNVDLNKIKEAFESKGYKVLV